MEANDIDDILKQWPFDPQSVNVRLLELSHRQVLQMRVDMGLLQLETDGRPDGNKFGGGSETYYEFLQQEFQQVRPMNLSSATTSAWKLIASSFSSTIVVFAGCN